MHGLINRSIELFLTETYGAPLWDRVAQRFGIRGFEPMLQYDDALTLDLIDGAAAALNKPRAMVLEDLGGFLVGLEPLRRLLRFGGTDFVDFLMSLDDLQGRSRMALPDLGLPRLTVEETAPGTFAVLVDSAQAGWGAVLAGLLRAMADDYGALVLVADPVTLSTSDESMSETVEVVMADSRHSLGRRFDLSQARAARS
ncbi:heme NO-binding domain-containing protein [Paracoccus sp. p4-l81]|uniref:heme NO-binding domain-containing protein n=1 Tax=unclassified Paracoccus (in: a-proteobacteria) TaxID=2688777 RepID=UPI0035BB7F1A